MAHRSRPAAPANARSILLRSIATAIILTGACAFLGGCDRSQRGPIDVDGPTVELVESDERIDSGIDEADRFAEFRRRLVASTIPKLPPPPPRGRPEPPPTSVRTFEISATAGGTHHATIVRDNLWLQSFDTSVLVLDPRSGRVISSIEVAPRGTSGPISDMILDGDHLLVVLERDAVAKLFLGPGSLPAVRRIFFAEELGIVPRLLVRAGGDVYVLGENGAIRWHDRRRISEGNGVVTGVAVCDGRLALALNRRVMWADEGVSRQVATMLRELPKSTGAAAAALNQTPSSARLTLLNASLEESDSEIIEGLVRRMRYRDDRLWAITDDAITSWIVEDGQLKRRKSFRVLGARDLAVIGPNRLAVAGSFGRAIYRPEPERGNPGDEFITAMREPSRLTRAITDGRRVLAGGREGRWVYLIGARAELTDRMLESWTPAVAVGLTQWGPATISGDRRFVIFGDGEHTLYPHDGALIASFGDIDGELWIGHETGIDLVGRDPDGKPFIEARLRLDGPVVAIFQKWDGGGAYVAEFGGFGVARLVETPLETLGLEHQIPDQSQRRGRGARDPR